ncbi:MULTISPECIES: endonuclease MutS2 [unclassified Breznakia]|uniref:endonuclease MutS2 n=1 Tax=unclassified Breznakia TaxID=2623764 RepID=UPI002476169C|nr:MULTISPECIES: endonuclease MutS2 [unclassified Breznakia]MDH6366039.1 DNA mismatch repair protein MutS2 [Breznakia sp. PH1-1]MDH6403029.1 DNA mismatch repair protein MutS2 [Breznakia sp. PF1-11]MDH6410738.1 DNA mismatch repair protein MutS2 [Breznakia sp. PFB1-11]MDH6413205.1 DNA mismatch repair protein MutS2 [Breznakia sp. PFB1-14]MDH6415573.1 DNA mismatch repair protein MutS2 [Breznakia sp. PFB1-4]
MKDYKGLDFEEVKELIAKYASFSLSKQYIQNKQPNFSYLQASRELVRGKESLKLYERYQAPVFAGVKDLYDVFKSVGKGKLLSGADLFDVAMFFASYKNMQAYKRNIEIDVPLVMDYFDALSDFTKLGEEIERKIDPSGDVKDHASEELSRIRKGLKQTESDIAKKTGELLQRYSGSLMDQITATRNNRTTLLVKAGDKNKIKGFVHDESASGQAVYIEPEELLILNNKLQSLRANEKNEMERIMRELCKMIEPYSDEMQANLETLTLLDVLFAQAHYAFSTNGCYADLQKDGTTLFMRDARHPLIDEKKVVANTYRIEKPHSILLISGSNTGGKTVTLKTIGLFTIMSMSGLPVLCDEAIIPLFDNVFVDVGDFQSILESLSTFSAHLSRLASIFDAATSHSLVLLDELGSGTDPNEGECLAIAILEYLKEHKVMSIATTHYSGVKKYAKTQPEILLSSVGFNLDTMEPTYKYMEGFSGNSNALEIAKRYHIKPEILQTAQTLREQSFSNQEILLEQLEKDKLELLEAQSKFKDDEARLLLMHEELDKAKHKQLEEKETLLRKARLEANEILEDARIQAKEVMQELRSLKDVKEHEMIAVASKLKSETVEDVQDDKVYEVKLHDYVKVKGLQYEGEIISLKGNKATILTNGMRMNVKTKDLVPAFKPKVKAKASVKTTMQSNSRMAMECNVIGMRVAEALPIVEKYIDNAVVQKMYSVRIVHGAGTGALRKAIHEYLKKSKYVDSYRLGGEGEGGLGATVVTLKGKK